MIDFLILRLKFEMRLLSWSESTWSRSQHWQRTTIPYWRCGSP